MKKAILGILFTLMLVIIPASASTKEAALQMTNTLENSQTNPAWNYAENINDGRGITFGAIGFCTGTYDGNILIKYYTTLNPNNMLAKYIPSLDAIDAGPHNSAGGEGNPSTTGLSGFIQDVQNCKDPLFITAQLYELDQLYWNPAVSLYNSIGAKYPLTMAFIYDMSVRHGPDGAKSIISKTTSALKGTPGSGIDEKTYLSKMISYRDSVLKSEGLGDTGRDTGYKSVLSSGNINLNTPFTFTAYGDSFTITGDLGISSGGLDDPTPIAIQPVAAFMASSTSGKAPLFVTFTSTSSNANSISWSFGDGGTSLDNSVSHTYNTAGTYTVTLTATNTNGSSTATKTITVSSSGSTTTKIPVASFKVSESSGTVSTTFKFTDQSTNKPTSWLWDFGDGSTASGKIASHKYTTAGSYTITLIVSNFVGSSTATNTITVSMGKPNADFSYSPTKISKGATVQFTDTSTNGPTSWSWNFGDRSTSTDQNPQHSFSKKGSYTVKLTVKNGAGSSMVSKTVIVS